MLQRSLIGKIQSKARWVARRYPLLNYNDLVQDGAEVALALLSSDSKRSHAYIIKAVEFHFSKLIRNLKLRRKILHLVPLTNSEIVDTNQDAQASNIDDYIDKQRFIDKLNNPKLSSTLDKLIAGYTIKEIADSQSVSMRSVYRQINTLRKKYARFIKQ